MKNSLNIRRTPHAFVFTVNYLRSQRRNLKKIPLELLKTSVAASTINLHLEARSKCIDASNGDKISTDKRILTLMVVMAA